jgi:hypothetical protein
MSHTLRGLIRRVRRRLQGENPQSGQAYVELLVTLPLWIVLIVGATYFGRAWYAKIAAEMAAYDGARAAIEAMSADPQGTTPGGRTQGIVAARQTMAGFYMNPTNVGVRVDPLDVWERGQAVRCIVRYRVDLSGVPWLHWIDADPVLPVSAMAVGRVEAYKSDWSDY